jgi:adenosylmethionine-8-amino-7-oxononanoate aminotransferase
MDNYTITYEDGTQLIDCQSGNLVFMWGYSQHQIADSIAEQLKVHPFVRGNRNETYELAESTLAKMCELSGMYCGSWVLTGSSANEAAIHMADIYNGSDKDKIVALAPGFFGTTHITRSAMGNPKTFWTQFPSERVIIVDNPMWLDVEDREKEEAKSLQQLEETFKRGDVGLLLTEAFPWITGILEYSQNWWETVRSLCDQYDVLWHVDDIGMSVMKGGNTYFYHVSKNVRPDIVTTGKAISNGYSPISLLLATEKVYMKIRNIPWTYGHAWQPNVAGIVAINEVWKLVDKLNPYYHREKLQNLGDVLLDQGYIVRYRQVGQFLCADSHTTFTEDDFASVGLLLNSSSGIDYWHKDEKPCLRILAMHNVDDQFYDTVEERLLDLFEMKEHGRSL